MTGAGNASVRLETTLSAFVLAGILLVWTGVMRLDSALDASLVDPIPGFFAQLILSVLLAVFAVAWLVTDRVDRRHRPVLPVRHRLFAEQMDRRRDRQGAGSHAALNRAVRTASQTLRLMR